MKHKNANRKTYRNKKKEKMQVEKPLHETPYLPGPGISRKTQTYQVNITFISTFWIKKTVFPVTEKVKTRTFQ